MMPLPCLAMVSIVFSETSVCGLWIAHGGAKKGIAGIEWAIGRGIIHLPWELWGYVHGLAGSTVASAETRSLVHVNPHAIDGQVVKISFELSMSPAVGVLGKPVGEHGVSRPNLANVFGAIGVLDKHILFVSSGIGRIG